MSAGKSTYDLVCKANGCQFLRRGIESKRDASRHAGSHAGIGGHDVAIVERVGLSKEIRVKDRIKLKGEEIARYREACALAGWDVNLEAIRTVVRIDDFGTGGRPRLFVEGPPFAFYPSDVTLAWDSEDKRREGLGL